MNPLNGGLYNNFKSETSSLYGKSLIKNWRNLSDKKITRIKGNEPNENDKLKLFEQASKYILIKDVSMNEIIKEILGFSDTYCEAFYKLSIDNSLFFYDDITRPITYLIFLCIVKTAGISITYSDLGDKLKEATDGIDIKLNRSFIKEVQIIDNSIYFNVNPYKNFLPIKLEKVADYYENLDVKYTKKIKTLGLDGEIYSNHDGKCKGAVIYYLEQHARANKKVGIEKVNIKQQYVNSLKMSSVRNNKFITNSKTAELINKYQNSNWRSTQLREVQNLYHSSKDITKLIKDLSQLLSNNGIDSGYFLTMAYEHAMGVILVNKGGRIKLTFYDPTNDDLYWSIYTKRNNCFSIDQDALLEQIPYLQELSHCNLLLLTKCYVNEPLEDAYKPIINSLPVIDSLEELQQQLILGVNVNDYFLVTNALERGIDPHFICNGAFPLTIAVGNLNEKMVLLLLKHGAKINCKTDNNLTPLSIAILKHDIMMLKLLLSQSEIDIGCDNLLDLLPLSNNLIIHTILKNHSLKKLEN